MFKEVEQYLQSNQTIREFVSGKEYSFHSLKYWLSEYRSEQESSALDIKVGEFKEVHLEGGNQSSEKLLEITSKNGTHIIIYH